MLARVDHGTDGVSTCVGGTAGLALASRLSENKKNIVGVIEAGQNLPDDPLIFTPGEFLRLRCWSGSKLTQLFPSPFRVCSRESHV